MTSCYACGLVGGMHKAECRVGGMPSQRRCGGWIEPHPASRRCKLPRGHDGPCSEGPTDLMAALKASLAPISEDAHRA